MAFFDGASSTSYSVTHQHVQERQVEVLVDIVRNPFLSNFEPPYSLRYMHTIIMQGPPKIDVRRACCSCDNQSE